jgi:hypothetical protein
MKRWFINGIHRLRQYCLVLNYTRICLIRFMSKLLKIHEETKRHVIDSYTMIDFCDRDRRCDPNLPILIYDSG